MNKNIQFEVFRTISLSTPKSLTRRNTKKPSYLKNQQIKLGPTQLHHTALASLKLGFHAAVAWTHWRCHSEEHVLEGPQAAKL